MTETKTYISDLAKHEGRIEQAYQIHRSSVIYADRPNFEAGYEAACSYFWNKKDAELAQIRGDLEKLDGDSLDAMIEVVGEGPDFKRYNQGKSAMRDWFLRRIRATLGGAA